MQNVRLCLLLTIVYVVSKVEIGLPTAAMVLDVISKSRSFNKWMILFTCHERRVIGGQIFQHVEGVIKLTWAVFLKKILSNVRNKKVTVNRPSF